MAIGEQVKNVTTAHQAIHLKARALSAEETARRVARADAAVAAALAQ